ncbi:MAG TPA: hypothetical protein VFQ30_00850 [Ktedonobacteraceae bacterium]|nr:hypothetical protein [Ktedonobacteraceae bacterium]
MGTCTASFGTQGKETPQFAGLAVYIDPFEQVTMLPVSVYYPRKTCLLLNQLSSRGHFHPRDRELAKYRFSRTEKE